ncbi:MAG: hypothetical protein KJ955_04550 [Nanoarchaeota archaeon]|nr:hypothetical protein [Nanoarchaeota archaeon]
MAEEDKIIKNFFFPDMPKIVMYAVFTFIVPAPLLLCADTCSTKWVILAGYRLLKYPDAYVLTFPRMLFMFAAAYIVSSIIATIISKLKTKPWHKKKAASKV